MPTSEASGDVAESVDHALVSKDAACCDKIFDNCWIDRPAGSGVCGC